MKHIPSIVCAVLYIRIEYDGVLACVFTVESKESTTCGFYFKRMPHTEIFHAFLMRRHNMKDLVPKSLV